jgi:transcriptional regulator with XRE-family HTH domain
VRSHLTHYTNPKPNTSSWQQLIESLALLRKNKGYSQEELAHRIGCHSSLIHKWEQAKRVPSGFMFACWLDALDAQIKIEIESQAE